MFIDKNELNIYNIIINFFSYKIMNNIDIFDMNIKLNIFYKGDNVLIIFKNNDNFKI